VLDVVVNAMVYLGAALMVYNIYCFIRYARDMKQESQRSYGSILYLPIALLVMFLVGYLAVGIFGDPDFVIGGILLGGSIFVYLMYRFVSSMTKQIIEGEHFEAELKVAEANNKAKAGFLASISHEMRTPLNVILGLDGMALKNTDVPPETREALEKIGFSARHLLDLVNNVLAINRIEAGDLEANNESFLLRDTWEQLNAIVGRFARTRGLRSRRPSATTQRGGSSAMQCS